MQWEGISKKIKQGIVTKCDVGLNLHVRFIGSDGAERTGVIPYGESELLPTCGVIKRISVISKVGKELHFIETGKSEDGITLLSRRLVQEAYLSAFRSKTKVGDIIDCKVINCNNGIFVDIGYGVPAFIPSDRLSICRIRDTDNFYAPDTELRAVVTSVDSKRITLSRKELLGSWEENIQNLKSGEVVVGKVRTKTDFGIFIELTANLAGLSDLRDDIGIGDDVAVYIRSIIPNKMKVKLDIIKKSDSPYVRQERDFLQGCTHIDSWTYSPVSCDKCIKVVFDTQGLQ